MFLSKEGRGHSLGHACLNHVDGSIEPYSEGRGFYKIRYWPSLCPVVFTVRLFNALESFLFSPSHDGAEY